jgi:hypothetical protein
VGLALVLYDSEWQLNALPGYLEFQRNEKKVDPFSLVASLASGETKPEDWLAFCDEAGIANVQLMGAEKGERAG